MRNLHAAYGPVEVLHGIDLEVAAGQVVAVLGSNGAGKTTTLRALTGGVGVRGSIRFDGDELVGRSAEAIVRRGIAHVPQSRGTFANLTVAENLRLGAYLRRDGEQVAADTERCSSTSRCCASGASSVPAACWAVSSRCWPSPAR